jgi:hypothetical protein
MYDRIFSLYKTMSLKALKAILSAFKTYSPFPLQCYRMVTLSQFIATLNLNKGDFILIDSELNVDAIHHQSDITQAIIKHVTL